MYRYMFSNFHVQVGRPDSIETTEAKKINVHWMKKENILHGETRLYWCFIYNRNFESFSSFPFFNLILRKGERNGIEIEMKRRGVEEMTIKPVFPAKRLGEQCFYRASCTFADQHSTCTQVQHNAVCDCEEGYHRVSLSRPSKKVFCAEGISCQPIRHTHALQYS